ncbi:hypothetical protein [Sandaracinus amylolyticus]|uniref:Uncharacterized protein n=1 Tax=Sandaracinus amylolyticus TaxID=927083 RepID=A0A0F6W980_9BACT|nr:hypothetical protein [Sandaracinus amylolyticus]AKF10693.1 hypothetical protein DB32_007842 [Sandaracinus amylolyticus]
MGAIISVAGDSVWMSTGSAEAVRLGLVACLRERGDDRTPLGARVVEALEQMWPADLSDDVAPYCEPEVRALLAPAWLAVTRDVASPSPRLVLEVSWDVLSRAWRIRWVANLLRISRAWTGVDLTTELAAEWPAEERALLDTSLAETAISRAWRAFYQSPTPPNRTALEAALAIQLELAGVAGPTTLESIAAQHARARRSADEHAARHRSPTTRD